VHTLLIHHVCMSRVHWGQVAHGLQAVDGSDNGPLVLIHCEMLDLGMSGYLLCDSGSIGACSRRLLYTL